MAFTNEQLAVAIYTANQWSAGSGDGVQLLSLGTTRKIHSEDHRRKALAEIDGNITYCTENDPDELTRLRDLRTLVETAEVGLEIIPHQTYFDITEGMYREGTL